MKKIHFMTPLLLVFLFTISCSKTEIEDTEVVFTSINASKSDLFIEDITTVSVEGTGFTDVNLTTSNEKVKIVKVSNTVFEISAKEALSVTLYAELKNNSKSKTKSVQINFAEHGVKNFKTAEGITVNTDKADKIVKLHGEPDYKTTSTDGLKESWVYLSKGFFFGVIKKSQLIDVVFLYGSGFSYTPPSEEKKSYSPYLFTIGNDWKLDDSRSTMDQVVNQLGAPSRKKSISTSSNLVRSYIYDNQRAEFVFSSDSEDNYTSKKIISLIIF